jgi:hypothetical protein
VGPDAPVLHCRQRQRLLLLTMMSEAELQALKGHYTLTLPLPNHKDARNRLLARGRAGDLLALQQQYPAVPASIAQKLANEQQGVGIDVNMVDRVAVQLGAMLSASAKEHQLQYVSLAKQFARIRNSMPKASAADKPALQLQLLEVFEAAAKLCSAASNPDFEAARSLHLLLVAAACIGDVAVAATYSGNCQWYPYATAQLQIRRAASSPQTAQLLLGPDPIEPEYLR